MDSNSQRYYPTLLVQPGPDEAIQDLQIGEHVFKWGLGELTSFGQEIALNQLRESPKVRCEAIQELRRLLTLEEAKGLIVPLDNDYWLIRFLRPCKFYPKSAFELMKRYYKFKRNYPKVCDDLTPSKAKALLDPNICTFIPMRDQLGRRFLVAKIVNWNYKEVTPTELMRGVIVAVDFILAEQETQVHGCLIVYDMDGFGLEQLLQFTPSFAIMFSTFIQECVPLRLKGVHVVNQNKLFSVLFNIFRPFLSKKVAQRIYFHGRNMESLHAHISLEYLPKEYGGKLDLPCLPEDVRYNFWKQTDKEFGAMGRYGYSSK